MAVESEILSLRQKRNYFVAVALGYLLISVGTCFPRVLSRHSAHKQANEQLEQLQSAIVAAQGKIRSVQGQIVDIQTKLNSVPSN